MASKIPRKAYEAEIKRLQESLVRMEDWVTASGARIAVIFEGRDASGKGGTIKRITEYMNPRVTKHIALPKPTERERGLVAVIERGKQRGEIRPDVDARVMVDLLGGPVVLRRLITGQPVNQRLAHTIVDLVLDGAAPTPSQ